MIVFEALLHFLTRQPFASLHSRTLHKLLTLLMDLVQTSVLQVSPRLAQLKAGKKLTCSQLNQFRNTLGLATGQCHKSLKSGQDFLIDIDAPLVLKWL